MVNSVRDVMTHAPWTVPSNCSLSDAARLMRSWDVREVFVVDGDAFCGVLSDADIIVVAIASGRPPSELTAGGFCNRDAPRVEIGQAVDDALEVLRLHQLGRAPMVDGDQLVGAVWINDLEQAVARVRPSLLPADQSPCQVRAVAVRRGRRAHLSVVPPSEPARRGYVVRPVADGETG